VPTSGSTRDRLPAQNALIAHDEDVVIPATATEKITTRASWSFIGKKVKHLSERDAMSCVLGYHYRH